MTGYFLIVSSLDRLVKQVHICSLERRRQCDHFVEDTAQRPYITLIIVGLIFPYLWRCIIGRASLREEHTIFLGLFGNIQVAKFNNAIELKENVGRFEISVQDLLLMESLQASGHLDETIPHFPLQKKFTFFFVLEYLIVEVATICELHHYAQWMWVLVKKGLFVRYDIPVLNTG